MGKNRVEYAIRIGPLDRYRHLHIQERAKIVFFRVQYESKVNQIWYSVVRYDTAHGFAHRDLLNHKGDSRKTPLFNQDLNDALKGDFWRGCMMSKENVVSAMQKKKIIGVTSRYVIISKKK